MTRAIFVGAVVALVSAGAWAHGTSTLEATFDVTPAGANPGATATLEVTVVELEPGAAKDAVVEAAILTKNGEERLTLARTASDSLLFRGAFALRAGSHDLRLFVVRGDKREVGMSGFQVRAALEPIPELSRHLFFNPAGRYDAIPWLDNLSGVVGGIIAVVAILILLRRRRTATAAGVAQKPVWLLLVATAGALMMPLGGYWDVAFHMQSGREGLFSPPHRLIYGGIVLSMIAVGIALLRKPKGTTFVEHWKSDAAAFAAGIAMAAQLASAPFDEIWHNTFGLDVSVWSPPHALLIFGGLAVCLTLASISVRGSLTVVNVARILAIASALLAVDLFLAESVYPFPAWHMSQHRPAFVFPLLEVVGAVLVAVVASRVVALRFAGTAAVAVFLALRVGIYPFLAALDVTATPRFPIWLPGLVVVGIIVDMIQGRRRA